MFGKTCDASKSDVKGARAPVIFSHEKDAMHVSMTVEAEMCARVAIMHLPPSKNSEWVSQCRLHDATIRSTRRREANNT